MSLEALALQLRDIADEGEVKAIPYARTLGLRYRREAEKITLIMPYANHLLGAPARLHGGTLAGLLEITSLAQLLHSIRDEAPSTSIKPITVTVDYLRAAACTETFAAATITRLGRRIADVDAEAWQSDSAHPIATAHLKVLIERD